jgi:hypothetical protein
MLPRTISIKGRKVTHRATTALNQRRFHLLRSKT